jgi:hypothetical protein
MYEFKAYAFVQIATLLTSIEEICTDHGSEKLDHDTKSFFQEQIDALVV